MRLAVAPSARNGLYDLDLFAGTGVLDKVPDVDDTLEARVRVVLILSGWVRWWCARLCGVHWGPFPLGRASGCVTTAGVSYVVNSCIVSYSVLTYKDFSLK